MDFSQVLTGPYCTQLLADMGADVIKVEPPGGDSTRKWGPPIQGTDSSYFLSLNRNKRSIALDLSERNGVEIANALVKRSDVIVENFRPGVMAKFGLSYREVKKINPSVIYCSISGYGQTGPLKHKPGYDIAAFAASGIMSITGEEKGGPVKTGVPIADIGGGLFAALAIAASLFHRKQTQIGCYIDIGLYDSMISWLTFQAGLYFATGENPKRMGSAHPLLVPYQAFRAKDRFFILAVGSDSLWKRACNAMATRSLADDGRFSTVSGRSENREELLAILQHKFSRKPAAFWLSKFEKVGVPCSPISTVEEALESLHTKKREMVLSMKHKSAGDVKSIASPIHMHPSRGKYELAAKAPPILGEDAESILRNLGYSSAKIVRFKKEGSVL